jgi:hypothetical protein
MLTPSFPWLPINADGEIMNQFWFWNGELEPQEMEWQMREYHSKGIPGIFIHGRFGLKVPYVSGEWFERVKFAVEKAKEIGIDTWVYDEMNWPSGAAERNVLKKYPHLTQRYLELVALNVDGPLFTFLEATDNRYVNTGKSHPIAAFGCTEEEYQKLQRAFPHVLFAGEGQHEQTLSALPVAQIHGIDGIAKIHGMEGQTHWREAHPVSAYLFGKYTRFVAHLLTKYPSHPMFKLLEAAYAKLEVIPALCLYDHQQTMDLPEVKKMLERAKSL